MTHKQTAKYGMIGWVLYQVDAFLFNLHFISIYLIHGRSFVFATIKAQTSFIIKQSSFWCNSSSLNIDAAKKKLVHCPLLKLLLLSSDCSSVNEGGKRNDVYKYVQWFSIMSIGHPRERWTWYYFVFIRSHFLFAKDLALN